MNTIQPIQPIDSIGALRKAAKPQAQDSGTPAIPFQSVFEDAVADAGRSDADVNSEIGKLATGQTDDLHNIMIASQKANLSVDLVVELRNKLLDAYKEVTNISV